MCACGCAQTQPPCPHFHHSRYIFTCSSIRIPHTILFEYKVSPLKTTNLVQTLVRCLDTRWHGNSVPKFLSLLTSSTNSSLLVYMKFKIIVSHNTNLGIVFFRNERLITPSRPDFPHLSG